MPLPGWKTTTGVKITVQGAATVCISLQRLASPGELRGRDDLARKNAVSKVWAILLGNAQAHPFKPRGQGLKSNFYNFNSQDPRHVSNFLQSFNRFNIMGCFTASTGF
jgi:hypothetical protein